jgi:glycosyltransferase involved in cell wall biosynthesis
MADLYISPSHVDGSSVSLMEALACGLPALVSDIPANQEWVSEGVNGWLFPDGNADILAEKILAVIAQRRIDSN